MPPPKETVSLVSSRPQRKAGFVPANEYFSVEPVDHIPWGVPVYNEIPLPGRALPGLFPLFFLCDCIIIVDVGGVKSGEGLFI